MRNFCPFTKDALCCENCALWLKDLQRCSFKEIAMRMAQSSDLIRELERLNANIDLLPQVLKKKI